MKIRNRKKKIKRVAALALALATMLSTVLPASESLAASTDKGYDVESLNNVDTGVSGGVATAPQLTSGAPGSSTYKYATVTVWQNDKYDSFTMYKIADISWNASTSKYKAASWDAALTTSTVGGGGWLKANAYGSGYNGPGYASFKSYTTPAKLQSASTTKQAAFWKALLNTESEGNIINGIRGTTYASYPAYNGSSNGPLRTVSSIATYTADADGNTASKTDNITYSPASESHVSSSNYANFGLTQAYEYKITDSDGNDMGTYYSEDEITEAGYSGLTAVTGSTEMYTTTKSGSTYNVQKGSVVYRKKTTATDEAGNVVSSWVNYYEGDVYSSTQGCFTVTGLTYGIYAVIATNTSGLSYSPVTVTVSPEIQAPSNDYYISGDISVSIKAGDIELDKKINHKDEDIVQIGETVHFDVVNSFPQYKDRVTLSANSQSTSLTAPKGYTLAFDDDLSTAYSIKMDSFKLYYRESTESDWKEFTNYQNIDYHEITDATYTGGIKTAITESNALQATYDKTVTYDSTAKTYNYTKTPNDKFISTKNGGTTYYYTTQTADAFTYVISSKSTEVDVNATTSQKGMTTQDTRGGWGMSVFACSTLSHKSYFQLYLFRYEDKPNLYYWYYMRDGAYYFICVDDISTDCRSMTLTDISGTSVDADGNSSTQVDADGKITLAESNNYYFDYNYYVYNASTGQYYTNKKGYKIADDASVSGTYNPPTEVTTTKNKANTLINSALKTYYGSGKYVMNYTTGTYTTQDAENAAVNAAVASDAATNAGATKTTVTPIYNLSNKMVRNCPLQYAVCLKDKSSYMNNIKALYSSMTSEYVDHGVVYYSTWGGNLFNITYNYNAMRQWMENNNVAKISQIKVVYDAVVSSDAETGVDTNTNTAKLTYEGNAYGTTFAYKDDTVYGYTYGVNVIKQDGDTVDSASKKYIAGAEFTLYKEEDAFVNGKWYGSMADSPNAGLTSDTTLESYKASHTGDDYYYYEYTADAAGSLDADYRIFTDEEAAAQGLSVADNDEVIESDRIEMLQGTTNNGVFTKQQYASGDKIVRVFRKFTINWDTEKNQAKAADYTFGGVITSTNKEEGTTIKGLDSGNYILSETKAPIGYNGLEEDILFSLYPIAEELAETVYGGSYKYYADQADGGSYGTDASGEYTIQGITDDDGIYSTTVLNYRGLTLPSTGGIGIVIFIIIGVAMMVMAIVIVLIKRKQQVMI